MQYSRHDRKNRPFIKVFTFGALCNLCCFFAFSFVASLILSSLKNPLALMGVSAFAVLTLTGALSGFLTAKFKGEGGALPSLLCAFILALLVFGIGLIAGGGKVALISPINLIAYLTFASVFAVLAKKKKRRYVRR